jgi:DNA-binding MarR family transcriptional regulator
MKTILKTNILRALNSADGVPFPESSLAQAVKQLSRPLQPTSEDVALALKDCDAEGYIRGVTDDFTHEVTWTLTEKGKHRVANL